MLLCGKIKWLLVSLIDYDMSQTLFVKHFHCIPPPYGGVSVYAKRLSLALTKNGFPSGAYYAHYLEGVPEQYQYLYDKYPKHIRSVFVLFGLLRLLKSVKKYKLIHSHASLNSSFAIWIIHKLLNLPIVYTVHNQMIEREYSSLGKIDKWCVKSLASDKSVQFIAVSQEGRKKLLNYGFVFKNGIKVIPAYIKPVEIGNKKDYLSNDLINFIEKKPYILFYAQGISFCDGKEIYGTESMINAFIKLRNRGTNVFLVFCIAEPNDVGKIAKLKRLIHDNSLGDYVYWQEGPIAEMWPLIKGAKLYLRPTSTDGDSILIREVLSFGIPVLASDVCVRPQFCETYQYGNISDLVDKADRILKSPKTISSAYNDYYEDICRVYSSLIDLK